MNIFRTIATAAATVTLPVIVAGSAFAAVPADLQATPIHTGGALQCLVPADYRLESSANGDGVQALRSDLAANVRCFGVWSQSGADETRGDYAAHEGWTTTFSQRDGDTLRWSGTKDGQIQYSVINIAPVTGNSHGKAYVAGTYWTYPASEKADFDAAVEKAEDFFDAQFAKAPATKAPQTKAPATKAPEAKPAKPAAGRGVEAKTGVEDDVPVAPIALVGAAGLALAGAAARRRH